jgi:hypothetical protein
VSLLYSRRLFIKCKLSIVAGVVAFLFAGNTQIAQAHFLPHKKHMTLLEKVDYFQRSIDHDQAALVWIIKYKKLLHRQTAISHREKYPTYDREAKFHKQALRWHTSLHYQYQQKLFRSFTVKQAICYVFGPYCSQALSVAYCETGGTFSVYAQNGQYLGLFQMGDYARSTYGHSTNAYWQARFAYNYFVDAGRDWSPWECKP